MAHQYSVEVHQNLSQQLLETQKSLAQAQGLEKARLQGREQELLFFRNYLSEHFDLKHHPYF